MESDLEKWIQHLVTYGFLIWDDVNEEYIDIKDVEI